MFRQCYEASSFKTPLNHKDRRGEQKVLRNMLAQGAAKLNLSPRPSTEYDTME